MLCAAGLISGVQSSAHAQDQDIKQQEQPQLFNKPQATRQNNVLTQMPVMTFYNSCIQQSHANISEMGKDVFCSCAAKNLYEKISPKELQQYAAYAENGSKTPPPIVGKVYAPCLSFAVSDYAFQQCRSNKFHASNNICLCTADYMTKRTDLNVKNVLAGYVQQFETMRDPVRTIVSDPFYKDSYKKGLLYCLQNKEKTAQ
jgi:hypothetical protein